MREGGVTHSAVSALINHCYDHRSAIGACYLVAGTTISRVIEHEH